AVLRRHLPGAARRLVRDPPAGRRPDVSQLGSAPAPPAVRGPAAGRRSRAFDPDLREVRMTVDVHLATGQERSLADDVLDGLTRPFKELPPKHFYDARGSELFDLICEQPEYYPTRTELRILRTRGGELMEGVDELVELGSGATTKARILL